MTTPAPAHPACAPAVSDPDRLAALAATGLLDAPEDDRYDRISGLVSAFLDVPVALVSLVDADRQFFASQVGLPDPTAAERQTPLSHSFCQHVVATDAPLAVEDARVHPVLRDNGAVDDLGVVAYLGVPIHAPSGEPLGSLCAIDSRPRTWTADERRAMSALVASVEAEIALQAELADRRAAEARARDEADALRTVVGVNAQLAAELDPDRLVQAVVDAGTEITNAAFGAFFYSPGRGEGDALLFAVSGAPREAFERFGPVRMTPLFEPSFAGRAVVRADDVRADPRYGRMGGMPAGHLSVRSYLSVPVLSADREPLGALLFGHPDPAVFDARSERAAGAIADQAAIALQNARLHRALDESERRHRAVLAGLTDVVFQTDAEGRYTFLNGAWTDRTGHAVGDSLGRSFLEFAAGDVGALAARFAEASARATPDDPRADAFRVEVACADGSARHFEVHGRSTFDGGRHTGSAGTLTDVTDTVRYHAEREAREAAEAAREEAERMARLQASFLANMSHEIRTPLTAILGYAEVLVDEVGPDLHEFASAVSRGGRRLMDTLNAVLDLAQIEAGQLEPRPRPVRTAEHLREAVDAVRPLADEKGLALTLDVAGGLPDVVLDPGLADRVVSNLLGNAVKFTERGAVTVRARHRAGRLVVEVEDTGVGIAPGALGRLFDPFEQASDGHARTHEGNGLGLAIARDVAGLLSGSVSAESAPGEGSRFTFVVPAPVVPAPAVPSPVAPAPATRPAV